MPEAFARPFRPVELHAATLTSFPLQAMAQQLMTEDAFRTSGRNALTLVHHKDLTVVLTVLRAGAMLPDIMHLPRSHCYRYLVKSFSYQQRAQPVSVDHSHAAVFAALPHRVEARQDSAFVLVMGGQA